MGRGTVLPPSLWEPTEPFNQRKTILVVGGLVMPGFRGHTSIRACARYGAWSSAISTLLAQVCGVLVIEIVSASRWVGLTDPGSLPWFHGSVACNWAGVDVPSWGWVTPARLGRLWQEMPSSCSPLSALCKQGLAGPSCCASPASPCSASVCNPSRITRSNWKLIRFYSFSSSSLLKAICCLHCK